MVLKIGCTYKCPEEHDGKIVWISEDKKMVAVKCPRKHFSKIEKVADLNKSPTMWRFQTKEKKIFVRNMVFLMKI